MRVATSRCPNGHLPATSSGAGWLRPRMPTGPAMSASKEGSIRLVDDDHQLPTRRSPGCAAHGLQEWPAPVRGPFRGQRQHSGAADEVERRWASAGCQRPGALRHCHFPLACPKGRPRTDGRPLVGRSRSQHAAGRLRAETAPGGCFPVLSSHLRCPIPPRPGPGPASTPLQAQATLDDVLEAPRPRPSKLFTPP